MLPQVFDAGHAGRHVILTLRVPHQTGASLLRYHLITRSPINYALSATWAFSDLSYNATVFLKKEIECHSIGSYQFDRGLGDMGIS